LVIKIANRGNFVVNFSLEDVTEVCTLRATLEQFALRLLIERADPADLAEMERLVSEMAAPAIEDPERVISELDLQFHAALVKAAHHKRLFDAWNNLRPQIQILLYSRNILNNDFRTRAVEGHRVILDALRDRDEPRASELLQGHLSFSYERLRQAYEQSEDAGSGV
jgi:DNA-binding GntR family transcriptional regulator